MHGTKLKRIRARVTPQPGHTLLELTIALALGLVVTGGAVSLYRSQRQSFTQAAQAAAMRDAGVNALTLIGQQVQMAGFAPVASAPGEPSPLGGAAALFGCSGARPVGAGDAPGCEPLASRSDGIVVRYVGDAVSTWPTSAGQATDCVGQGIGGTGVPQLIVNRYFARVSASTGEPELYCEGNGRTGVAQPLVEGVERLRIRYWLQGAAASVDAAAIGPEQWSRVVAVDLCVLVRGGPTPLRARYLDCDGVSVVAADRRERQAFRRRVAVRNNEPVPQ